MQTLRIGSSGPYVRLVQSVLSRIGYRPGVVDGVFGRQTQEAVRAFQRAFGLTADGIVGPRTWAALERYILGYDEYAVQRGDTFYSIARKYQTTPQAIVTANPELDPANLMIGQIITVPYGIDVVPLDVEPTYDIVQMQIRGLLARYPFLETGLAGRSVMGKEINYIRLGKGDNPVTYNASHHANEYITTPILMRFVENYSKAYSTGGAIRGYSIPEVYDKTSIYVVPLVNPDGVDLVTMWPNYTDPRYTQAAALNKTGQPLPLVWKANIRGVDINLNYPAAWDLAKEQEREAGITGPGPRDFGGDAPLSEPESAAMVEFTRSMPFRLVIAYHTQGEVIFWQFLDLAPAEALPIAERFGQASGYGVSPGYLEAAYAGYKDWFIQDFGRPGYTVEAGRGTNPLPISQAPAIYDENEGIFLLGATV